MWSKITEAVSVAMFLLAVMFLGFVGGSVTTLGDTFPSQYVRKAYRAGEALMRSHAYGKDPYTSNLWVRARSPERGVTVHDPDRAQPGLTLYSSGHASTAILVDMQGRTVHQWKQPFHDIWDETAVMRKPVPERQIYFHKARAFPNGELLAVYDGIGDTPWGYGMVKLDKDSNVIWKNLGHRFHHDFAVAGDGRIFGISHEFRREPLERNSHLQVPLLEDFVVMLSPNGNTLKEISLLEALRNSRFGRELWRILHFTLWDPLHTNSIEVLDHKTAAALRKNVPVAEPGQVLLAFRELDGGSIALLDVDKEQIVWVLSGSWRSPHDPDILPNGNILMFDNLGDFGPGGESRVVEVNPATGGVIWEYGGDADHPLSSHWRSDQQRLANGNTLITESNGARLVEITPQGDIVWEYINPVRGRDDESVVPVVSWSSRIDPGTTEGQFRALLQRRMAQLEASAPSAGYETATR